MTAPGTAHIPIINIVSYSYKGGSGRSTASVNIAFKLMKMGKLVVVLDMDVGAAGLHMILGQWDEEAAARIDANTGGLGHQMFFNSPRADRDAFRTIDPALLYIANDADSDVNTLGNLGDGAILFLFSSTDMRTLTDLNGSTEMARNFVSKYNRLQQFLAERVGGSERREVYFIVDAPNGITHVSLPLLKAADLVLMFYRHSLQHVQGTIEAGKKLYNYLLDEFDRRYMRVLLVGSCVPEKLIHALEYPSREHADGYLKDMLEHYHDMKARMRQFAEEYKGIIVPLEQLDPNARMIEDDVLKVLEQPLTTDGIERKALGYEDALDGEKSSAETNKKLMAIAEKIAGYGPGIAQRKSHS